MTCASCKIALWSMKISTVMHKFHFKANRIITVR